MPYPYSWTPDRITPQQVTQVTVWDSTGQPAVLSTPVSVSSGTLSFALSSPGTYHLAVRNGTELETGTFTVDAQGNSTTPQFTTYAYTDTSTYLAPTGIGTPFNTYVRTGDIDTATATNILSATSATATALSATYVPNSGGRLVGLGDSIPRAGDDLTQVRADSYNLWATVLSGGKLQYVRNAGVGGNTTAQMLARFDTDVTPYRAEHCVGRRRCERFHLGGDKRPVPVKHQGPSSENKDHQRAPYPDYPRPGQHSRCRAENPDRGQRCMDGGLRHRQ